MNSTGRITEPLPASLRRRFFGPPVGPDHLEELTLQTRIDRAWVVMLTRQGLCDADQARLFVSALDGLKGNGFRELMGRELVRGLYLLYEEVLTAQPGGALAADLQRGRSRNDVSATITKLRLRPYLLRLQARVLRLIRTVLQRASECRYLVMPLYTHGQQAVPGTMGHYLAGVCEEVLLSAGPLFDVWPEVQRCPLGASAVGGTSLPVNTVLVAELLGFDEPVANSLRAVASRGYVLTVLSSLAMLELPLSRLAHDLELWCSDEFSFARLPDYLVGSSSHMPQKRNAFLLESVQGLAGSGLGAFVAAHSAMVGQPMSNSVAVGTEAVRSLWPAMRDAENAVVFLGACVEGISFQPEAMLRRAKSGAASATALAELLVRRGMPFRVAHRQVGELTNLAEKERRRFLNVATEWALEKRLISDPFELDPTNLVAALEFGGGPAPASVSTQLDRLRQMESELQGRWRAIRARHRAAAARLRTEVERLGHG